MVVLRDWGTPKGSKTQEHDPPGLGITVFPWLKWSVSGETWCVQPPRQGELGNRTPGQQNWFLIPALRAAHWGRFYISLHSSVASPAWKGPQTWLGPRDFKWLPDRMEMWVAVTQSCRQLPYLPRGEHFNKPKEFIPRHLRVSQTSVTAQHNKLFTVTRTTIIRQGRVCVCVLASVPKVFRVVVLFTPHDTPRM